METVIDVMDVMDVIDVIDKTDVIKQLAKNKVRQRINPDREHSDYGDVATNTAVSWADHAQQCLSRRHGGLGRVDRLWLDCTGARSLGSLAVALSRSRPNGQPCDVIMKY
jgi:hypothetical protein